MSVETTWYIPNVAIYQRYAGTINMEEVQAAVEEAKLFLQAFPEPHIHLIADFSEVSKLDMNLKAIQGIRPITGNNGWYVMITNNHNPIINQLIKFMSVASAHLFGVRLRIVNSLDDAEDFLSDMDNNVAVALNRRSA